MSLAVVFSRTLCGADALEVRVETHMSGGLPAFHIVGLPDTEVRESRERVRAAIQCIGLSFPAGRLTVNLSPADLPKASGRFDLPIALGVLLASGQLAIPRGAAATSMQQLVFAGELSLSGALVDSAGPLTIAIAVAREHPGAALVLPPGNARHAARVPGLTVYAAVSLDAVVAHLAGYSKLPLAEPPPLPQTSNVPCLSDVRGQPAACRALEVAAAGGHSMLFCGTPGVGKSMLAQRLPGILPPLTLHQSLEVAAHFERSGMPAPPWLERPLRAPHHRVTVAALIGGGLRPRPGEITLADHGVLFLDELPEFSRDTLEALREPLESGWVALSRVNAKLRYPARCQLVAAMNPCPCGWRGHRRRVCRCTPEQVARYRHKLSGPLLDRVDMHVQLPAPAVDWMDEPAGETSDIVRVRVAACQARQRDRQGVLNAALDDHQASKYESLAPAAVALLRGAAERWDWSARTARRVARLARTVADMAHSQTVESVHLAEAAQYRPPDVG